MRIYFDPTTLHQSEMAAVTAVVYFEFSPDRQFPVAGWNDFVVVLANWWMAALEQIIEGQAKVDFLFMDGPFWISAASQGTSLVLSCTDDRRGSGVIYNVVVQIDDLKRELRALAREVSVGCKRAGIESPELDELRRHLPN